jgi:rSAM/selenodomain-associated transferase 1
MHQAMKAALAIFTRVPEAGRVKTRLAPLLGGEGALAAHCALVEDTLQRLVAQPDIEPTLWVDGEPNARVRLWQQRFALPVREQKGEGLGARMAYALADALANGVYGLVVGTDCPPIDGPYVSRALAALRDHDVVFGPAEDGGYGLVGLRRPCPDLFVNVAFGTDRALADTLHNAIHARQRVALLPAIWDVDEPGDWQRWQASASA